MAFGTTPSDGTQYALWKANPPKKVAGSLWGGKTKYGHNAAITVAAGGQINLVRLEVGDVVVGGRLFWTALGASTQIWLGDAGDCDRYKTQTNGAVASLDQAVTVLGNTGGDCTLFNNIAGIGYTVTSTTQDVILTVGYQAATSALSAGAIKVVIELA